MVVSDTRKAVEVLLKRNPSEIGKFERNRNVSHNSLVIAGTRIPVSTIKEFSAAGYSVSKILKEYPSLSRKDVEAAIAFKDKRNAA